MAQERERLDKLLEEVGRRDGIELKLNQKGAAGLELKNGVKLFFEYVGSSNRLYFYTPLMPIPPEDSRRFTLYEAMLSCNFLNLGCETGGLSIFRHTGQAVYQTGLNVTGLTAGQVDKAIEDLRDQREEVITNWKIPCPTLASRHSRTMAAPVHSIVLR